MTRALKGILRKTGALDVISRITTSGRVEILLYHGFSAGSERDSRFPKLMPVEQFEEQIRTLAQYGRPLRLEELPPDGNQGIAITFDDGYANNYQLAFPVLQKYQFPATVFLTTGFVDRSVPLWGDWLELLLVASPRRKSVFEWRDEKITLALMSTQATNSVIAELKKRLRGSPVNEIHNFLRNLEAHLEVGYDWRSIPEVLRPLQWDEVRAMRRSGLVSFGAHTVSHPVLSTCTDEVQKFEIVESKRRIEEELGEKCTIFAYPYGKCGDYTSATKQIVRKAGYELAVSAESGFNTRCSWDEYELKRWGADMSVEDLSFIVSGGPVVSRHFQRHVRN
jgi:peptidoglycan/xylan/chitin deacetylase (PgdA/CDA1 family)